MPVHQLFQPGCISKLSLITDYLFIFTYNHERIGEKLVETGEIFRIKIKSLIKWYETRSVVNTQMIERVSTDAVLDATISNNFLFVLSKSRLMVYDTDLQLLWHQMISSGIRLAVCKNFIIDIKYDKEMTSEDRNDQVSKGEKIETDIFYEEEKQNSFNQTEISLNIGNEAQVENLKIFNSPVGNINNTKKVTKDIETKPSKKYTEYAQISHSNKSEHSTSFKTNTDTFILNVNREGILKNRNTNINTSDHNQNRAEHLYTNHKEAIRYGCFTIVTLDGELVLPDARLKLSDHPLWAVAIQKPFRLNTQLEPNHTMIYCAGEAKMLYICKYDSHLRLMGSIELMGMACSITLLNQWILVGLYGDIIQALQMKLFERGRALSSNIHHDRRRSEDRIKPTLIEKGILENKSDEITPLEFIFDQNESERNNGKTRLSCQICPSTMKSQGRQFEKSEPVTMKNINSQENNGSTENQITNLRKINTRSIGPYPSHSTPGHIEKKNESSFHSKLTPMEKNDQEKENHELFGTPTSGHSIYSWKITQSFIIKGVSPWEIHQNGILLLACMFDGVKILDSDHELVKRLECPSEKKTDEYILKDENHEIVYKDGLVYSTLILNYNARKFILWADFYSKTLLIKEIE